MPSNRSVQPERIARVVLLAAALAAMTWPLGVVGWTFAIQQSNVGLALPDIRAGAWEITGSRADIRPSVTANGNSVSVEFAPSSRILTDRLAFSSDKQRLYVSDLRTDLSQAVVRLNHDATGPWASRIAINGDIRVDAGRVEHPRLVPQAWHFEGSVAGQLEDLRVQGTLTSAAGLSADLDVQLSPGGGVAVTVRTTIEGPEDIQALAGTFADWPALLSVESGTARVVLNLWVGPEGGLEFSGRSELEDVSGVFNRTAVSGLGGQIRGDLEDGQLSAGFREVTVAKINAGIPLTELRFTGSYAAPEASPLQGSLDIQRARARFLEGTLRIPPGTYDFKNGALEIPVELQSVSLGRLMEVYPAEGLSGSGQLRGRIPVRISGSGDVQVAGGHVSAVEPGGRLQFPANKLQSMLGSNQAMDLVVKALQNFHYSVLNTTIDYDEQGTLTLDLRLEGRNPNLQGGRPVVLNVNLQEDIPALLTSLQLSGRVNEAVTRRVRELLQQSSEETAQ